tara:strand:+ start:640 stop:975 length:336 start_codon:yes stop_codon:yes gene_type:complete
MKIRLTIKNFFNLITFIKLTRIIEKIGRKYRNWLFKKKQVINKIAFKNAKPNISFFFIKIDKKLHNTNVNKLAKMLSGKIQKSKKNKIEKLKNKTTKNEHFFEIFRFKADL